MGLQDDGEDSAISLTADEIPSDWKSPEDISDDADDVPSRFFVPRAPTEHEGSRSEVALARGRGTPPQKPPRTGTPRHEGKKLPRGPSYGNRKSSPDHPSAHHQLRLRRPQEADHVHKHHVHKNHAHKHHAHKHRPRHKDVITALKRSGTTPETPSDAVASHKVVSEFMKRFSRNMRLAVLDDSKGDMPEAKRLKMMRELREANKLDDAAAGAAKEAAKSSAGPDSGVSPASEESTSAGVSPASEETTGVSPGDEDGADETVLAKQPERRPASHALRGIRLLNAPPGEDHDVATVGARVLCWDHFCS